MPGLTTAGGEEGGSSFGAVSSGGTSSSDAVLSISPFDAALDYEDLPHPFALFDEVHEVRTLAGEPNWGKHDFISAAMANADLPGKPIARFLKFEVVSLPSPQVMLTMDHGLIPHRGVVFDLQPCGGRICVLDVTPDATLLEALMTLQGRLAHVAAEIAIDGVLGGSCVCHVNRRIVNAWAVLPPTADLVQFSCLQGAQHWGDPSDAQGGMCHQRAVNSVTAAAARAQATSTPPQSSQAAGASGHAVAVEASAAVRDPLLPALYTCFNFLEQRLLKRKEPGWTDEDRRQDALRSVWFAMPRAIILEDPVEGSPLPQVLVFKVTDLNEHLPVVLACQGERCEPLVTNIPRRASVATFLSGFRHGPGLPEHGVIDVAGGYTCSAKGVALSCFSPLPPDTRVVRVRRAVSAEHPLQLNQVLKHLMQLVTPLLPHM